jgi:hypothetical protein
LAKAWERAEVWAGVLAPPYVSEGRLVVPAARWKGDDHDLADERGQLAPDAGFPR